MKNNSAANYVGTVQAVNDADNVVYAKIAIGNNQTLMAQYTVPLGWEGYLFEGTAALSAVTRSVSASGRFLARPYGGVFQLKSTFGVGSDGGAFIKPYKAPMRIAALTDIEVLAKGSAAGVVMDATFGILLVK